MVEYARWRDELRQKIFQSYDSAVQRSERAIMAMEGHQVTNQLPRESQIVPPFRERAHGEATDQHKLSYHGGKTIANPTVVAILAGNILNQAPLRIAITDIVENGYLDKLANYGSGRGRFDGIVNAPAVPPTVDDNVIQGYISTLIADGQLPRPDGQTIYMLFLPDGVVVNAFGGSTCQTFCGYHGSMNGDIIYTVHPGTACMPCHGSYQPFDALTSVISHEIAEAVTNPFGDAWFEDSSGEENADICAWQAEQYGPWVVQPYWTNEEGCAFGAFNPNPNPQPKPQPDGGLTDNQKQNVQTMIDAAIGKLRIISQ